MFTIKMMELEEVDATRLEEVQRRAADLQDTVRQAVIASGWADDCTLRYSAVFESSNALVTIEFEFPLDDVSPEDEAALTMFVLSHCAWHGFMFDPDKM